MVINPNNTTHTLKVLPRFYPDNDITVYLFNEASREEVSVSNTYNITNGKLNITFDFTFVDKDRHQLKVSEGEKIVYRGKLVSTTQEPQDFKLTNDLYYYS